MDFHPEPLDSSRPLKTNIRKVEQKALASLQPGGMVLLTAVEPRRALHVAAVHPLPLAWCPPKRRGSAKGTIRVSYSLISNSVR